MKIALVIERMDPLRGGRETYTAQVAAELARRGHYVCIVCQDGQWEAPGVEVVRLGRHGLTRCGRMRRFVDAATAFLASREFDVTHAMLAVPGVDIYHPHGGTVPSSAAAHVRRRRGLVRGLYAASGLLNAGRRQRARLERRIVADKRTVCLCVSELIARQFERDYGRTENVRVIFNGVAGMEGEASRRVAWRREVRLRIGAADDETLFVVVATNFELKGVAQTLRALARWKGETSSRARLAVVGRESVGAYRRLADDLGVTDCVHFEPPTREIRQWYAAADAMILLTWYDPCSLVVLEAVRWRLPPITTAFNGAADALAGGAGIVIARPDDTAAAVAALQELSDPLARRKRVEACAEVEGRLTLERHVDELVKLYEEIAARKNRERSTVERSSSNVQVTVDESCHDR